MGRKGIDFASFCQFTHLDHEVQDLAADRLKVFTEAEMKAMSDGLDNEARKEGGLVDIMPFVYGYVLSFTI